MRSKDFVKCPKTKAPVCECSNLAKLTEAEETVKAIATLEHTDDGVEGVIKFKQNPGQPTIINGIIKGLTPGKHGFHIHEFGDLSKGCESAGAHYNPDGVEHGSLEQGHVGDLGNITADDSGITRFQIKAHRVDLSDVVGRAVVIHADEDDLGKGGDEESLKTGNAGSRVGCGVIRLQQSVEEAYKRKVSDKHFDRNQLPQIRRPDIQDSPFDYVEGKISIEKIKPVQSQRVDGLSKKAEDVFLNNEDRPFIIDRKGYLINGHHRYDAAHILGIKRVPAIMIDADIEDVMKTFAHTTSDAKTMAENYFKNLLETKMNKPQFDVEWEEANRYPEFRKIGKDAWIELASKGKAVTVKDASDINNTDAGDPDSFKTLDPAKQKRAMAQIKSGKIELPLVAVYSDGHKELIGGNTRLTAMMAKHGKANVWQFEVPDEILENNVTENFDDDDIVEYYDEIHPVVIKAWKSVYPNVPLKAFDDEDMYMQYTTADEYEHHGGNGKDFYLSLGVQYIGDEEPAMGYINVGDAYAGNYKGAVAKIIASLFEWLEKQHPSMGARELGIHMNRNAEAWNAIAQKVGAQIEKRGYYENFADGKVKGKSRPGRVKKAGASCKGSVSSLRAKAKKYSGERGKMYHWCANMKGGKKKK